EALSTELSSASPATSKVAKKATESKKVTAPKKVAEPKSLAPKKTTKKPKVKNTGFSVKAFWAGQIEEHNPGSQQPR
ncbi:MAG: hypothetical protein ACI965_001064, partial [Paraglaciecola sp.]